jgi:hypothetical protein
VTYTGLQKNDVRKLQWSGHVARLSIQGMHCTHNFCGGNLSANVHMEDRNPRIR